MQKLHSHPEAIPGAASYWAEGRNVVMRCTDGHASVIDTKRSEGTALDAAKAWQEKENKVVAKHAGK